MAGSSQALEYTVLVGGTQTVRIVSDQAGKRIGDCVAVEQGQFANIRLVPDSRCAPRPQARAGEGRAAACAPHPPTRNKPAPASRPRRRCWPPKTDEEFNAAERRMRLLCGE